MKEITISTEYIKLDQFLKYVGIAEIGGHSKEIVKSGIVKVNDEIVLERGKKLRTGDVVEVEGKKFIIK